MRLSKVGTGSGAQAVLGWLVVLLTAAFVFHHGERHPEINWDIVGYVAAAYSADGIQGQALLDNTYGDIRSAATPEQFKALTNNPYRAAVARDPESLRQQVPFYSVRWGYVAVLRFVHRLGPGYARSSYLVSALFTALAVLVLAAIASGLGVSLLVVPLVVFCSGLGSLAAFSTPDAFAAPVALLALYLALRESRWVFLCMVLLPVIRQDMLIFSGLLACVEYRRGKKREAVGAVLAGLLATTAIAHWQHGYPWQTWFVFTFLNRTPYPASTPLHVTPSEIAHWYVWQLQAGLWPMSQFLVLALTAFALIVRPWKTVLRGRDVLLGTVPLLFAAFHAAVFPLYGDRYTAFAAAASLLWLLALLIPVSTVKTVEA